jgi:hypothetical protein
MADNGVLIRVAVQVFAGRVRGLTRLHGHDMTVRREKHRLPLFPSVHVERADHLPRSTASSKPRNHAETAQGERRRA